MEISLASKILQNFVREGIQSKQFVINQSKINYKILFIGSQFSNIL